MDKTRSFPEAFPPTFRRRVVNLLVAAILIAAPAVIYHSPDFINQMSGVPTGDARLFHDATAGNIDAIYQSLSRGCDPNATDEAGYTPLHAAVMSGSTRAVHLLIQHHADVSAQTFDGVSVLELAITQKQDACVGLLLKAGADPNLRSPRGRTPLYIASLQGSTQIIHTLLTGGAQINASNAGGSTALIAAVNAFDNDALVLRQLLAAGADPNQADNTGTTPLMEAAQHGQVQSVLTLLRSGADLTRLNHNGHNARMLAEREQYWRVAELLSNATSHRQA